MRGIQVDRLFQLHQSLIVVASPVQDQSNERMIDERKRIQLTGQPRFSDRLVEAAQDERYSA